MSDLFQYDVDGETVQACLALIAKHAGKYANVTGPAPSRVVRRSKMEIEEQAADNPRRPITGQEIERLRMLIRPGRKVAEIAKEWGRSYTTTLYCARRLGLRIPNLCRARHAERAGRAAAMWREGKKLREIAQALGVSISTACHLVHERGPA